MQLADVGQTFHGRYALRERLGDGGTASVFRADDLELGRTVAIKVYGPESEVSDTARRQREARALAGLRHPAIVTLFDARLDAKPPYLVLEFVDGETLARRIARGPLSAAETSLIGAAAATGLAAAHDAGIVHRDVKPANIMIPAHPDPEEARLLDFGIAHSVGGSRATTVGSVVGSAVYLSPEQARGVDVTPGSDIYSLGLVLIECLTGRPAFTGTAEEVLGARLVRPPALDDPALAADAPLLARMTALEAADRPSAGDVARELGVPAATRVLAAADADLPTERMPGGIPPIAPAREPRTRRRVPLGIVLGSIGTLLAGGIIAAALLAGSPSPSPTPTPEQTAPAVVITPTPDDEAPGNSGNSGDHGKGKDKKP
ncbi:MAG TPA: serine/threonine-protein kinase [Pseudolysinimonas sp.]|nr:serine/threonine-protein kinase [Pseudolysinimonas sp.]